MWLFCLREEVSRRQTGTICCSWMSLVLLFCHHIGFSLILPLFIEVVEKDLNHIGSHVDIKTCSKKAIDEMFTLINPMESHFRAPLVSKNTLSRWWCENPGSMSFSLSTPKFSPCVCSEEIAVRALLALQRKHNKTEQKFLFPLCIYIYIYKQIYSYIPHYTYTIWTTWLNGPASQVN